ncbi:MAG: MarR family transcriptional regulator [Carnobacterium inhibens]|uniref:MarR family transcriptional regulator n=1 Tax=Carnobacterium inhibens TaxID=147709 RepID=UPI003315A6D1
MAPLRQLELQFKILDTIYTKGPISRIDISKETGITPATVTEIARKLISDQLIHETGELSTELNKSGRKKFCWIFLPIIVFTLV